MSITREYTLWCDKCRCWSEGTQDCYVKRVRQSAKEQGWKHKDKKDYCPDCAKELKLARGASTGVTSEQERQHKEE